MQTGAHTLRMILASIFTVSLISYTLFESYGMIRGPQLTVHGPKDGDLVANEFITVSGTAKNISHISLNGRQIYTDEKGGWREQLLVPEGYTILELKANDRFKRESIKHIRIIHKDS